MRQHLLRVVCDECGVVATFETVNFEPLVVSTRHTNELLRRHSWTQQLKEGGSSLTPPVDKCPACGGKL